jgi:hypothetical protein
MGVFVGVMIGSLASIVAAQTPAPKRQIIYTHTSREVRDAHHPTYDIYSVNADGTDIRAFTSDGNSHSPLGHPTADKYSSSKMV